MKHREVEFSAGDWVYLKKQPYRQSSLSKQFNQKLSPKFFGPYQIIHQISPVAYKLSLPTDCKIYPVFHVSLLKKKIGPEAVVQSAPPAYIDLSDQPVLSQAILETRVQPTGKQLLVHWKNHSPAEATWEDLADFKLRYTDFVLEDKEALSREG